MLSAKISTKIRQAVYSRDGYACALCQSTKPFHVHHVTPRSQGGTNELSNLICLCFTCHSIVHGEYQLTNEFPFDKETAEDAIHYYLEYQQ